jgi:hypothetical protein
MKKLSLVLGGLLTFTNAANAMLFAVDLPAGSACPTGTSVVKTDPEKTNGKVTCGLIVSGTADSAVATAVRRGIAAAKK